MDADITSQAVGLASNTDFSILSLFLRADFVVKSVIIILIACSVYSWAIIFDKFVMFRRINKDSEDFEENFIVCFVMFGRISMNCCRQREGAEEMHLLQCTIR